ncbi:MAG: hypothetical protein HY704_09360 [Gemmatimonadetes bacterium]|nr:hypothetical protein [Gemmatimonadota bacterium]
MLLGWEVIEPPLYRRFGRHFPYGLGKGSRFPETRTNQIIDVLAGIAGFLGVYLF